ncbi:hypothetical protein Sterm_0427 [Sebaldella termitidis ATCC 33386]|uniref:Uncharacterized protein n=1 Tax=Sebaldella termitidis (strain ATCC 33386 / NCTC 11300) TaxID=526218 RepID=D1AMT2_SEBTE|nr:hypothetical protein Sterm_0427 [Sebaldella termitidis ATCC 33386]
MYLNWRNFKKMILIILIVDKYQNLKGLSILLFIERILSKK